MKAFYLFIIFSLTLPAYALSGNAEWRKVDSIAPEYKMYRFYEQLICPDSMHCLIKAFSWDGDPILRLTTDGGETWKDIYKDSTRDGDSPWAKVTSTFLNMIAFPSPKLIIGVGDSGRIIRSTNLGVNWEIRTLGKEIIFRLLKMLDNNYGVVYGNNLATHKVVYYETTNGGEEWKLMNTPQTHTDSCGLFDFVILRNGLIVAKEQNIRNQSYSILHIHNNWNRVDMYPIKKPNGGSRLFFLNDSVGWRGGGGTNSSQFRRSGL